MSLSDKEIPASLNDSSEGKYRRSDVAEAVREKQKREWELQKRLLVGDINITELVDNSERDWKEIFGEKLSEEAGA
ncbi:MAG: hypothetical protein KKE05_06250 [Nanoarchaeota archaeon]|nr:hypothetical protein [Nanoarchaeota archaeon]